MSGPYDDAVGQMEFVYCVVTLWVLCPNFSEVLWNVKGDKQKGWWPLHTRLCDAGAVDGTAAGSLEPFVPTVCPHQAGDTGTATIMCNSFLGVKIVSVHFNYFSSLCHLFLKGSSDEGKGGLACSRHQLGYLGAILVFVLTCVSVLC